MLPPTSSKLYIVGLQDLITAGIYERRNGLQVCLQGNPEPLMSALGHKRTYAVQNVMSALPSKADMPGAARGVCFGPIADVASAAQNARALPPSTETAAPVT